MMKYDIKDCYKVTEEQKNVFYIIDALRELSSKEFGIIWTRFGCRKPLEELTKEYSVTPKWMRRLEIKAMKKIRRRAKATGIDITHFPKDDDGEPVSIFTLLYDYRWLILLLRPIPTSAPSVFNSQYPKEKLSEIFSPEEKLSETFSFEDLCKKSIDYLELSARPHNCLYASGIHTIGQLIKLSEFDFLKIKNLGKKGRNEIISSLRFLSNTRF